ncbi:TPA: DUF3795 domain-containing protein [Candidatus Bathyarchaeota archaeon]|nr:DUF3795 domain-containing protein [Candidatus Bathyarchaeota archaeon]
MNVAFFRASSNPILHGRLQIGLKKRDMEIKSEGIRCLGCKGDRTEHWSPDCWILKCCVDKKGLGFCHECEDFPCERLEEWAKGSKRYEEALDRIKGMGVKR